MTFEKISTAPTSRSHKLWPLAKTFEIMSAEEEASMLLAWQRAGCVDSRNKVVNSHLRLAFKHAAKWARRGGIGRYPNGAEDLIADAVLGLIKAADKFDVTVGARFATYAAIWMDSVLRNQVISDHSLIRIATTPAQKSMFSKLRFVMGSIPPVDPVTGAALSRQDIVRRAADKMGLPQDEAILFDVRLSGGVSLDTKSVGNEEDEDVGLHGTIADDSDGAEEILIKADFSSKISGIVQDVMKSLTDREADIIRRRLLSEKPHTLEEIAGDYGLSRERIRQIEGSALVRLRKALSRNGVNQSILG